MMGALFLREHNLRLMEKSVENIQVEDLPNAHAVFLWSRAKGFICILLLSVGIAIVDKGLENCENIVNMIVTIDLGFLTIWLVLRLILHVYMKQGYGAFSWRFLEGLIVMYRPKSRFAVSSCLDKITMSPLCYC